MLVGTGLQRRMPPALRETWVPAAIVIPVAAAWFWSCGLRPRYLRFAPGRLQVLKYTYWGRTPEIADYPAAPGMLCVVYQRWGAVRLALGYGTRRDELLVSGRGRDFLPRLWQALLSTAPTPPLSTEGLVG